MSVYGTLSTATRALETHSTRIQVAGDNIANVNTPGYVRNEITLAAERPYSRDGEIIGAGVFVESVRQRVDQYLEERIHASNADAAASAARESIYKQLELELRELGDTDLSTRFSSFVGTLNEVVNQPEQGPLRNNVIEQGKLLAADIRDLRSRVDRLRAQQGTRIRDLVSEANGLIDNIQGLNNSIASLESNGLIRSQAGSLRSQRYQALNRLSEIVPITYLERANGVVDITSGSDYILLGNQSQHLGTNAKSSLGVVVETVVFEATNKEISTAGGEIKGVFEARDQIIGSFIEDYDKLVGQFVFEFNRIHSSGEGLAGFTTVTSEQRVANRNVAFAANGLPFQPRHGSFQLKVTNQQTGVTQTHRVAINADGRGSDDTSFDDLRAAIDGIDNISASITTLGELTLSADAGYEFKFSDDTSGVLAAIGINTFFTGTNSSSIGINATVANNQRLFAAGQGNGPSDNRNAVKLAGILESPLQGLGNGNLSDFYDAIVSRIGQGSAKESAAARGFETFRDSLLNQREQFSGISLDEEAVKLIDAQQAFAASARVITTVDELINTLLNM